MAAMARMVPVRDSRVRTERTTDGLRIDVARRMTLWRVVTPLWAGVILTFGAVGMLASDRPAYDAGAIAFMVVWFGIAVSVVLMSLWALLYREELLLDARTLTHRRRLGPIRRERSYARERIEDVRVRPDSISSFDPRSSFRMLGIGAGTVAFDYGDRTYRIADVDEAEAKRVVEALAAEGLGG
jgi:hypothetical protein